MHDFPTSSTVANPNRNSTAQPQPHADATAIADYLLSLPPVATPSVTACPSWNAW